MRFECPHCSTKSRVRTSERISPLVSHLYIECSNTACNFAWRVDAYAKTTLSPSARPRANVLIPFSRYVLRERIKAHFEKAPVGDHHGSGPLQLTLDDNPGIAPAPPVTQHPS